MGLAEDVRSAIALLGGPETDRVIDLLADPGAGARALDALEADRGIVMRVVPELGAAAPGYAPAARHPRVGAGDARRARGGHGAPSRRRRDGATGRSRGAGGARRSPAATRPSCVEERVHAQAWLVLEGIGKGAVAERLLVAEGRGRAGQGARRGRSRRCSPMCSAWR